MSLRAVIFDVDGIITDSEEVQQEVINQILAANGIILTPRDIAACLGVPTSGEWTYFREQYRLPLTLDQYMGQLLSGVERRKEEITVYDGFEVLVDELTANGVKLATSTSNTWPEYEIMRSKFIDNVQLEVEVTRDQLEHGKPHHEAYSVPIMRLRELMGKPKLKPSECVVIEDSANGIIAAKAAGAYVVGVTTTTVRAELEKAKPHRIVSALTELSYDILNRLVK